MIEARWHEEGGDPLQVIDIARSLADQLAQERMESANYTRAYLGESLIDVSPHGARYNELTALLTTMRGRGAVNLLRMVIDTAQSQVCTPPDSAVSTYGQSWRLQRSAKKLGLFLSGVRRESGFNALLPELFVDAALAPVSAVEVVLLRAGGISIERVPPGALLWDPLAGPKPRDLYVRMGVSRTGLMEQLPDKAAQIAELPPHRHDEYEAAMPWASGTETSADMVTIYKAWHLGSEGVPGRHVVCAHGVVLLDEEWTYPRHAIVPLRWSGGASTYGGTPVAKHIWPMHYRYNTMLASIDEHMAKGMRLRVIATTNSGLGELPAEHGRAIYHAPGSQVQLHPGVTPPPAYFNELERTRAEAFALAGVSLSSAEGTRPAGINSGEAQRVFRSIAAQRLSQIATRMEDFVTGVDKVILMLAPDAYKNKKVRATAPNTSLLQEISWSDIDLDEDQIVVRVEKISALPAEMPGRIDTLHDIRGLVGDRLDGGRVLSMLGMPDLDRLVDEESAIEQATEHIIDEALGEGRFVPPDPMLGHAGLTMLAERGRRRYVAALTSFTDIPPLHLEVCRRVIMRARWLLSKLAPADVPPAVPGIPPELAPPTPT